VAGAGLAGFEPAASSSRSQVHTLPSSSYPRAGLARLSVGVRGSPPANVAIVTQLATRSVARPQDGRRPAVTQSPPRPARGGRAYHHQKKEHPENSVQTFIGIAADREESNAAGTDADGGTLQQCVQVVSFGWRCWLAPAREARVNAGVDFLVDFLEEGSHHRVAVLRAKLIVRRGGGVNVLTGQRGVTHAESVAPSAQASIGRTTRVEHRWGGKDDEER
jgi:hypothetical protein